MTCVNTSPLFYHRVQNGTVHFTAFDIYLSWYELHLTDCLVLSEEQHVKEESYFGGMQDL